MLLDHSHNSDSLSVKTLDISGRIAHDLLWSTGSPVQSALYSAHTVQCQCILDQLKPYPNPFLAQTYQAILKRKYATSSSGQYLPTFSASFLSMQTYNHDAFGNGRNPNPPSHNDVISPSRSVSQRRSTVL
ncbi:hypothetical protein PAAG_03119 [Paracoccidioides lutzii Pb01]|uniref:Uncharacterized protein n=1 Tax=Paracoccidioides lutzii (strain ATCC MYA-826 / Pb01) TaxID=502779 RepID=C1GYG5_PARBA|nr:hypothetical protein PAAG_03119 [Paracoccidioides lutzii Pb01]EEH41556.2 hypothetical protein PAAG_03119 [Paracoccidioides lutzii Pb01]